MPDRRVLKSEPSTTKAFVRFINKSYHTVDIIWVNFTGVAVLYKTLKPNEFVDVDTYTNHPWIFVDITTKDRMCVDGKSVFYAEPWYNTMQFIRVERRRVAQVRVCIVIHFPLHSLKMCSLLKVRDLLKSSDGIDSLELPSELKEELQELSKAEISLET